MTTTKTALVVVMAFAIGAAGCAREAVQERASPTAEVPAAAADPEVAPVDSLESVDPLESVEAASVAPAAVNEVPATTATAEATATVAVAVNAAPDFTLTDIDGAAHTLSDYRGKIVVLEWINHGCPFVKKHYDQGHMQGLQATYTGMDVVWLSICSSASGKQGHFSAEKWKKVNADKGGAASAILLDEDGSVGRLYGARTTPHMYVLGKDGALVYQGAIDSKKSTKPADIASSTNYVSEVLDAALAGQDVPHERTKPYGCSVKYAPGN